MSSEGGSPAQNNFECVINSKQLTVISDLPSKLTTRSQIVVSFQTDSQERLSPHSQKAIRIELAAATSRLLRNTYSSTFIKLQINHGMANLT